MSHFVIPENLAISDTGFLFMPATGETFTLNEMGKNIFKMIQGKMSPDQIFNEILENHDVDRKTLERDFHDFIHQLKNFGLIKEV